MNCYTSPLPTKPVQYNNCQYWIDGDAESKPQQYWYFVANDRKKPVRSDQTFGSVVEANGAARAAIDNLIAVVPPEVLTVEPTPSKRRTTSRIKKS